MKVILVFLALVSVCFCTLGFDHSVSLQIASSRFFQKEIVNFSLNKGFPGISTNRRLPVP